MEMEKTASKDVLEQDNYHSSTSFAQKLLEQNQEFCIIGLTGKIKSGTSDVCKLLSSFDFCDKVTQPANTEGFTMSEIREHKVIYRYLHNNWRPFVILEATSVIFSFLLDLTEEELQQDKNGKHIFNIIQEVLENNYKRFLQCVVDRVIQTDMIIQYKPMQEATGKKVNKFLIESACTNIMERIVDVTGLLNCWKEISEGLKNKQYNTKEFIFCYGILPVLDEFVKIALEKNGEYSIIFQYLGNNIRAIGKAVNKDNLIDAKNLFSLSERMNQFIKILRDYPDNLYEDVDELWKRHKKHVIFIVINNFKNIFEAYYFKKRYSVFYLLAVSCDEKMRQSQFVKNEECNLADLKENFSKGKKIYNIAAKYLDTYFGENDEKKELKDDDEKKLSQELGINSADFEFMKEIFNSEDMTRKLSYENKVAQFVLQDVMTCIENADIFVTRNYKEDYKCDYSLIRLLGRIVTLIFHPGLLTPTKLERCMQIAMTAKLNSGCLSRQVGAVVTDSNYDILSLGWNDAPCGVESCIRRNLFDLVRKHDPEAYSEYELYDSEFRSYINKVAENLLCVKEDLRGLPFSFCFKDIYQDIIKNRDQIYTRSLHGEERALSVCGNERARGGYLFTTSSPCELCAKKAKEANIRKIYYIEQYPGISQSHIINVGKKDVRAQYEFFVGAVGGAYVKLYTPLMPYKDELADFQLSPVDIHNKNS